MFRTLFSLISITVTLFSVPAAAILIISCGCVKVGNIQLQVRSKSITIMHADFRVPFFLNRIRSDNCDLHRYGVQFISCLATLLFCIVVTRFDQFPRNALMNHIPIVHRQKKAIQWFVANFATRSLLTVYSLVIMLIYIFLYFWILADFYGAIGQFCEILAY